MKIKYTVVIVIVITAIGFAFYSPSRSHVPSDPVRKRLVISTDPYIQPNENPGIGKLLRDYEVFMRTSIRTHLAPGAAVVIVRDTSIIYAKGFGLRNVKNQDSVDIHSVFRIGSVSKSFASVLTGMLVDQGLLSWTDPVVKYLPRFALKSPEQTRDLTLQHVLSHTTGLPYHAFTDRVDDGANFDSLVYHLRDLDLLGKPGQIYSYQNVGYSLIGEVIRAATGKTYAENLQTNFFTPLHMYDASVYYDSIKHNKNVAQSHRMANGWVPMKLSNTYYNVAPAGGINASISDMGRWLKAITGDSPRLVTVATRAEIFKPRVRATTRNHNFWRWKPVRSAYYALGWRVINFANDTLVYHGGFVNDYRCEIAIDLKNKIAICVLVNSSGALANTCIPHFFALYDERRDAIERWDQLQRSARELP